MLKQRHPSFQNRYILQHKAQYKNRGHDKKNDETERRHGNHVAASALHVKQNDCDRCGVFYDAAFPGF